MGMLQDWQFPYLLGHYPVRHVPTDRWRFDKHCFKAIHALKVQGKESECAQALDRLPEVTHWMRNIEQQEHFSFWRPTATDCVVPDAVVERHDGRLLATEHTGEPCASNNGSAEERAPNRTAP